MSELPQSKRPKSAAHDGFLRAQSQTRGSLDCTDDSAAVVTDSEVIARFLHHTLRFGAAHGTLFLPPFASVDPATKIPASYVPVPYSLFPSAFPKAEFKHALELAPHFGKLVHRASLDVAFLHKSLAGVSLADEFTGRLLKIHEAVLAEGVKQPITLGILRSDYMLQETGHGFSIRQVEINTIASSFGCLGTNVSDAHRYAVGFESAEPFSKFEQPVNHARQNIVEALARAHKLYAVPNSVVVMIVQENERNALDQWFVEHDLWVKFHVKLIRRTLTDFAKSATLDPETHKITIDGNEVSVAYFRAGYTPNDYPSEKEWEARLNIEKSVAIKCPNIAVHLVGAKKFQQVLAEPGNVERFVNSEEARLIRSCFAGLWSLQAGEGEEILKLAVENPEHYVLKPQREGGGNNIYGNELKETILKSSAESLESFILMERLYPPYVKGYYVREGSVTPANLVAELGIFGMLISRGSDLLHNEAGGFLLRSKAAENDDGGVAAGVAVLDSAFLV